MTSRILNAFLLVASLFGYLEWGGNNQSYLFQVEWEVISRLFTDPGSVLHPFIILPLLGQLILLFTVLQKHPDRRLTLTGICLVAVLFVVMLVIGMLSLNFRIIASTLPFLLLGGITIKVLFNRKIKTQPANSSHS